MPHSTNPGIHAAAQRSFISQRSRHWHRPCYRVITRVYTGCGCVHPIIACSEFVPIQMNRLSLRRGTSQSGNVRNAIVQGWRNELYVAAWTPSRILQRFAEDFPMHVVDPVSFESMKTCLYDLAHARSSSHEDLCTYMYSMYVRMLMDGGHLEAPQPATRSKDTITWHTSPLCVPFTCI